jgi:hypothetical protein
MSTHELTDTDVIAVEDLAEIIVHRSRQDAGDLVLQLRTTDGHHFIRVGREDLLGIAEVLVRNAVQAGTA